MSAPADPMVIASVTFMNTVEIGGSGVGGFSLYGGAQHRHHGRIRVEPCAVGMLLVYKAGPVYQEVTVYAANIGNVVRVPRSSLDKAVAESMDKADKELRR